MTVGQHPPTTALAPREDGQPEAPPARDLGGLRGVRRSSSLSRPPSVLFLSWKDLANPEAGGSELFVDELILALQDRGHRAGLVCGGPTEPRPYPVIRSGSKYTQYLKAPFTARRVGDWDLLVEVVNGFPWLAPLWWPGPRLCFFHHVHEDQWFRHFPRLVADVGWFVEGTLLPRVYRNTVFGALSDSTAASLVRLGIPESSVHVVHVGLDQTLFDELAPAAPPEPTFVCVGRLVANKGIDRILDAWKIVQQQRPGRLLVIGDGPDREVLERRGVPRVDFLGKVDEATKRQIVAGSDLLVHGAHREGWGMVITEAAALGTPSLAFDADGVRDAIVDGDTGRLAFSVKEMAATWIDLTEPRSPVLAQMAVAGRERARRFTWDRSAAELLEAARAAGAVVG